MTQDIYYLLGWIWAPFTESGIGQDIREIFRIASLFMGLLWNGDCSESVGRSR